MSSALAITLWMAISLQDAVTRALAHSPELRALEAGVAEARANAEMNDAFRSAARVLQQHHIPLRPGHPATGMVGLVEAREEANAAP